MFLERVREAEGKKKISFRMKGKVENSVWIVLFFCAEYFFCSVLSESTDLGSFPIFLTNFGHKISGL